MPSLFRKGGLFSQLFMGAIVVAIIAAFLFTGQFGSTTNTDRCAVKLDDECVDLKEFNAGYGLAVRASGLELTPEGAREIKGMILNGFAERLLLSEDAKRFGISASEEDLDQELMEGRTYVSLPAEYEGQLASQLRLCLPEGPGCAPGTYGVRMLPVKDSGSFNPDLYRRVVRNYSGRGPKQFKEMQQHELVAARMRQLVRSQARVSQQEAFVLWERERSQATIRSVQAHASWMARYVLALSEADVDEWAMNNKQAVDTELSRVKEQFKDGCPLVSEIRMQVEPGASDEEKKQKRTEIEQIEHRLKTEKFELLAREASDAPSGELGGAVGCLDEHYGPGAQELLQTVGTLKPGKVSPIVESVRGFHLIELLGTVPAGQAETTARSYVARKLATEAKARELSEQFSKDLIAAAKQAESLQAATDQLVQTYIARGPFDPKLENPPALADDSRPKVEISAPFNALQNPIRNALQRDVASIAFQLKNPDALHETPIKTSDGAAVLQLKSKEPAKREDFEKDKVRLLRQLDQIKASEALKQYLDSLRTAAGNRLTFDKALLDSTQAEGEDESQNDES